MRVIGKIIRVIIRIILFPLIMILLLLELAAGYVGAVIGVISSLIGTVFILGALIGHPMGIVTGESFWQMILCGICFGTIPAALASFGKWGTGKVRTLLSRI